MIKYISEYRDKKLIGDTLSEIKRIHHKPITLMEVCGGHTMSLHKNGIPALLPETITLLSGPGCPVCVTSRTFIDNAVAVGRTKDSVITTFGDLMRVPGSETSLEKEKAAGRDIRIVYSSADALNIAGENPGKQVVFLGIGFETTAPSSAAAIMRAKRENLTNFSVLPAHKVMPPAMAALIDEGVKIDGYICPGHVSTITGSNMYLPLVEHYGVGCVVSGFEPLDLLQTIYMLIRQHEEGSPKVENQYIRAVTPRGNLKAIEQMNAVFEPANDWWRGLGMIPGSGLTIRDKYRAFDAYSRFQLEEEMDESSIKEDEGCRCADVLKGSISPPECPFYGTRCTPEDPVGACMVSSEGACAAWFRYSGRGSRQ